MTRGNDGNNYASTSIKPNIIGPPITLSDNKIKTLINLS